MNSITTIFSMNVINREFCFLSDTKAYPYFIVVTPLSYLSFIFSGSERKLSSSFNHLWNIFKVIDVIWNETESIKKQFLRDVSRVRVFFRLIVLIILNFITSMFTMKLINALKKIYINKNFKRSKLM